jgi:hypothetical protein
MPSAPFYDTIGAAYTVTRHTEPRIAEQVWAALGDAQTVLNVGAGTGSYELTCTRPTRHGSVWFVPPGSAPDLVAACDEPPVTGRDPRQPHTADYAEL